MPWYPRAIRKEITRFRTKQKPVRINYHTAVSSTTSLYAYFAPTGRVCSHFYVREDGVIEQYVDTAYRAAADLDGNSDTISIETWDGYLRVWRDGQAVPPWNAAQMRALSDLTRWILAVHPSIPKRIASDSRVGATSQGLSWHRLGCPYRVLDKSQRILGYPIPAGYCQPGGIWYSTSAGKQCPGDARIAQVRTIYASLTTPQPEPVPEPETKVREMRLLKSPESPHVYLTDGLYSRHIGNPEELKEIQAILRSVGIRDDVGTISAATLGAIPLAGPGPAVDPEVVAGAVKAALADVPVAVDADAIVAGILSKIPARITLSGDLAAA